MKVRKLAVIDLLGTAIDECKAIQDEHRKLMDARTKAFGAWLAQFTGQTWLWAIDLLACCGGKGYPLLMSNLLIVRYDSWRAA